MSEIKVELNGEDINRAIADAIVKSLLGETIVKMVNEYVQALARNQYDSPLKKIVETEVKHQIELAVMERMPEIKELVVKQLADGTIDSIVNAAVQKLTKSIY